MKSVVLRSLTVVVLSAIWVTFSDAADWPLFRGNPAAQGVVSVEANAPPPKDAFRIVWQKTFDKGYFEASPIVVGDTIYQGCSDDYFYAFDLRDGSIRWKYPVESGVLAPATYWKSETAGKVSSSVPEECVGFGDPGGTLHVLDAKTGELRWKFVTGGTIHSAPNVLDGRVYVGSENMTLSCLDAKDGRKIWEYKSPDMIQSFPSIAQDRVFFGGCDGSLHVVDRVSGKGIASVPLAAPTGSTPAICGDFAYLGTEGNEFLAIDWKKAEIAWRFPSKQAFRAPAAIEEKEAGTGFLIIGGYDRKIRALDPRTGKEIWGYSSRKTIDGGPLIRGDRVYAVSNDAKLVSLDLKTGRLIASIELDGEIKASPAIVGDAVVVGTLNGVLYRIEY